MIWAVGGPTIDKMAGTARLAEQSRDPGPSVSWVSNSSLSQAGFVPFDALRVGVLVLARRCLFDDAR